MKQERHFMQNRRGFLGTAAALAVTASPLPALANLGQTTRRTLGFHNLHTGERLTVDYWAEGRYIEPALGEIDNILRDFRTGEVVAIDRQLLDSLHRLRQSLDVSGEFHVISGYRSPKTNKTLADKSSGVAKKSLHMRGMAIDVRVPGVELAHLKRAAIALKAGGVGYYPKSGFIHFDVGRVRSW